MLEQAYFRLEANERIGAGHAIRSGVLADALVKEGWKCVFVTTQESYDFIKNLERFERVEPEIFYNDPKQCDLLVIDNYDVIKSYESHFRSFAKKIMVLEDLPNREHDCDILLDQTYGRNPTEYAHLVPKGCTILTGSDYVLLREEFIKLRPKAIEKRRQTKEVKRILISMGGSDPKNFTIKAIEMVKASGFKGVLDVVLGFKAPHLKEVEDYLKTLPNESKIHLNASMPDLIYEADLAIGAAGSSVWERCCLGLPQVLLQTADNQADICSLPFQKDIYLDFLDHDTVVNIDGFGVNRVLTHIFSQKSLVSFRDVRKIDLEMIFSWQNVKEIRQYFNNSSAPTFQEHSTWFKNRLKLKESPYWIILYEEQECGLVSLTYCAFQKIYDLSWFILPEKQNKGLGTTSLKKVLQLVKPFQIRAYVKKENKASRCSLEKAGFIKMQDDIYTTDLYK